MTISFVILAALTAGSAVAAMSLRNLVHCALSLVLTFAGLAGLFLQLGAEFVGFAQVLVYVGAVSILIVFAILLTRGDDSSGPSPVSTGTPWAVSIAVAAFVTMAGAVTRSPEIARRFFAASMTAGALPGIAPPSPGVPSVGVKSLGDRLMGEYILPLEIIGLLLTAALIGAVIIAMQEKRK
jgi:NADH-quinone oxidoreductase subunit J